MEKGLPEIDPAHGKDLVPPTIRRTKGHAAPAMPAAMIDDLGDRNAARQPGANSTQGPLSLIAYDRIFEAI